MTTLLTIIAFVVIFSVLILIHEMGHFLAAKKAGIKVEEFGLGLPPRIWGKKKGETIYSINWIPFGGFVRMLGEDSLDKRMAMRKNSFIGKSLRVRAAVIVAGVFMNFILAWGLLTVGLTVGMQPLLLPQDVLPAVDDGRIILEEGQRIEEIIEGSFAEKAGFKSDDLIFAIDGQVLNADTFAQALTVPLNKTFNVLRGAQKVDIKINVALPEGEEFGFVLKDSTSFPRVKVFDVARDSAFYLAGLKPGDILLEINGHQIFSLEDYESWTRGVDKLDFLVYSHGKLWNLALDGAQKKNVMIERVIADNPAAKAGLKDGDIVISVDGFVPNSPEEMVNYVAEHAEQELNVNVTRGTNNFVYKVLPQDGKIGVLLSELMIYGKGSGLTLYNTDLISSVVEIKNVQYPVHQAVYKALEEGFRLSKMTAAMFIGFVENLLRNAEVSENVSGPIGIYQMTNIVVQEGFVPILRFVAILSLSLAVINILPFPALDGGRLLFILFELVFGKKVNQKWESLIHMVGYGLILLLIVVVSYSDIVRLMGF